MTCAPNDTNIMAMDNPMPIEPPTKYTYLSLNSDILIVRSSVIKINQMFYQKKMKTTDITHILPKAELMPKMIFFVLARIKFINA